MGRNKQVWNNAAPVATLQLKTLPLMRGVTGLVGWRQVEAFGNGNILFKIAKFNFDPLERGFYLGQYWFCFIFAYTTSL